MIQPVIIGYLINNLLLLFNNIFWIFNILYKKSKLFIKINLNF